MTTQTAATAPSMSVGRRPDHSTGRGGHRLHHGVAAGPGRVAFESRCGRFQRQGGRHLQRAPGCSDHAVPAGRGPGRDCPGRRRDALGRAARRRGAERSGESRWSPVSPQSLSRWPSAPLGCCLPARSAPDGETDRAGRLFDLINRMDGVKMFALAAMAAAGVGLVRRKVLPRWLGYTAAF